VVAHFVVWGRNATKRPPFAIKWTRFGTKRGQNAMKRPHWSPKEPDLAPRGRKIYQKSPCGNQKVSVSLKRAPNATKRARCCTTKDQKGRKSCQKGPSGNQKVSVSLKRAPNATKRARFCTKKAQSAMRRAPISIKRALIACYNRRPFSLHFGPPWRQNNRNPFGGNWGFLVKNGPF
jgi:hypothetical protein